MEMFRKISVTSLKYLNGFLPINKPKGVDCNTLLNCIKKDFNYVITESNLGIPFIDITYARQLDPFANGLVTIIFGSGSRRKRNFVFADYRYKAKVEFGVERRYDCIDGDALTYACYSHITEDAIRDNIRKFQGWQTQNKIDFIEKSGNFYMKDEFSSSSDIYNLIEFVRHSEPQRAPQKYPLSQAPRLCECHSIELTEFNLPFVSFDIYCRGGFTPRGFVRDLSESLNTKASLIEMTRYKEGPMSLEDERVLDLHELNLEYYVDRLPAIQRDYSLYLKKLDCLFENTNYHRGLV